MFTDEYVSDPLELFRVYWCVNLHFKSGLKAERFPGVQNTRVIKAWNKLGAMQNQFAIFLKQFPTRQRFATLVAANLVIDSNCYFTDYDIESYNRLKKFNLSSYHLRAEISELIRSHPNWQELIGTEQILPLVVSGEVSPELFACLYKGFDLEKALSTGGQKLLWDLIGNRFRAYVNFIPLNRDINALRQVLVSELSKHIKHK